MAFSKPLFSTAAWLTGAAALLASLTLGAAPAQAHDELISTNPAADAVLTQAPGQLELTYSGEIMDVAGANQVRVTNTAGDLISQEDPEVKGKTVTQDLPATAGDDTYTVAWRVVSSDGHPIQGTFTYTVGEGATSSAPSSTATAEQSPTQGADPLAQASEGLGTGPRIALIALVAVAIVGAAIALIAKTKKRR